MCSSVAEELHSTSNVKGTTLKFKQKDILELLSQGKVAFFFNLVSSRFGKYSTRGLWHHR